jgi:hypothetical protein
MLRVTGISIATRMATRAARLHADRCAPASHLADSHAPSTTGATTASPMRASSA